MIAGALRRKTFFDMGYFQWSPNFYTILVAPSGIVAKSTTMRLGTRLLKQVSDVSFGPNNLTWQSLPGALNDAAIARPNGNGELITESCLTFAASEFGSFLDPRDQGLLNVLVDLYDGQDVEWRKRTKGAGDEVVYHPWINLVAATTPSWIAENMGQIFVGGGFTSRCLFVYADKKRLLDAYPIETIQASLSGPEFKKLEEALAADLQDIATIEGQYTLSPDALTFGKEWYEKTQTDKELKLRLGQFDGYLARRQSHLHKLAMVLTAAQGSERIIQRDSLEKAALILDDIEQDMPLVLSGVETGEKSKYFTAVLSFFDNMPVVIPTVLYSIMLKRFGLTKKEFGEIYDSMELAGMIEEFTQDGVKMVRRKEPN